MQICYLSIWDLFSVLKKKDEHHKIQLPQQQWALKEQVVASKY